MRRLLRASLIAAGLLVVAVDWAHAQAMGQIFGKVTDASGGVLPGVTVTVTGTGLQQPLVQATAATGAYQFPTVPIGTYTVTFELASFKKATRQNVIVTDGFNAQIDMKMEIGAVTEEMTVTAASPVVDTKKTSTTAVFTKEIFENIPTARDPWQIINMTPGVQAGLNVGGSSSGQQVGLQSRGTGGSVQWNLEGGSITDLSSNSSPAYFNFDSFEQISVTNGGGDVSVQSSGLMINLVTKSGSNLFKGSVVGTFQNDKMQGNNVSQEQFDRGASGFLSGAPIFKIYNASIEYGGPILRNRLWWWAAADRQEINAGVVNFFDRGKGETCSSYADAQRAGSLLGSITYDELEAVQGCLSNDQTVIRNLQWKFNYQLNAAHKFMYQFHSDNKVRNARGASANTEKEATTQQTSDKPWGFPLPSHQISHTWLATDKLVFNTLFTKVFGGFYLDYQDYFDCGGSKYLGSSSLAPYLDGRGPDCMFNIQPQTIATTGNQSRSLGTSYQTLRPSLDLKTDATYFMTNFLGGDHSLKFGVGYRQNPILSYRHTSGGGRATMQCVGNSLNNCGDGRTYVAPGSAVGLVPRTATLGRDSLLNNDWWSYNGYIQDSYSRGRIRINAGLRYDWQQSKWLGGCVPENPVVPDLLPGYCESAATGGVNPITGEVEELRPFSNWSPRVSATYDLFGDGKTALKASGSYYYATKITLANALSGLGGVTLTWGNMTTAGRCSSNQNTSCWQDLNLDGFIQRNELSYINPAIRPTLPRQPNGYDIESGLLNPTGNRVDSSAKLGRTREATVGLSHELFANFAAGAEFIYRRYDNGTANYTYGYHAGTPEFPLSQIYEGPFTHFDEDSGLSAPYYQVISSGPCPIASLQAVNSAGAQIGCIRPNGLPTITMTRLSYESYKGVDITLNKRYSDRWMMNMALTLQNRRDFLPLGSFGNPTGVEFDSGLSTLARYVFKLNGSYNLPWGITASGNLNVNDGGVRIMEIDGPGDVYGGVNFSGTATPIELEELRFQPDNSVRFERTAMLDIGIHKTFSFNGGRQRIKLMLDGFNVLNSSPILEYDSNNLSTGGTSTNPIPRHQRIEEVLPPRVFRVGTTIWF
jgi:hypothetical protein